MAPRADTRKDTLVDKVAEIARRREKGNAAKRAETFLRGFYANVPPGVR